VLLFRPYPRCYSSPVKVIDAHTGLEVHVGDRIALPHSPGIMTTPEMSRQRMRQGLRNNFYVLTAIYPGIFSASADAWITTDGKRKFHRRLPLTVRWTHPNYPWQHVAFVPS